MYHENLGLLPMSCHVFHMQALSTEDLKRHSSHIEILDPDGNVINTVYYENDVDEEYHLPKNKSFDFEMEQRVHERRVQGEDGKVKVVRDTDTHNHMEFTHHTASGDQGEDSLRNLCLH